MTAKKSQHEITQRGRTLHVELSYTRFAPNVDTVVLGCIDVSAIDDIEVAFNHAAYQWEIYRDVKIDGEGGSMETVAKRVLLCSIPAWSEPTRPARPAIEGLEAL
ncbi:hypothetical protein [Cellulomonas sp. NPDC058312]|uniref:hypothetical protein n=1 Tax=Cellulomonas sp. NPDC058312 TaxID=3346441 RepID=UPI0036ECC2EB